MQQLPEFLVSFVFQNLFEYSLYFPKCLIFSLHFTLSFNSMFSFVMCFYLKFFFIPSFDISLLVTNSLFLSENILIPLSYLCNILGEGMGGRNGDFQELIRPLPTCWSLMVDSRTVMVLVGVSLSLLIQSQWVHTEDQGQVQVDASATLDLFGSNKLMLCPPAMSGLCYFFFLSFCSVPFPPVSFPLQRFYFHMLMGSRQLQWFVFYNCFKPWGDVNLICQGTKISGRLI